jgi:hypothetical protein
VAPTSIQGILPQVFVLPAHASHLEALLAVVDGYPHQLPAGAATLLDLTPIVHGLYPDLDLGHLCRLVAAVADTRADLHRIGPDHGQGRRLLVDVGAVVAVDD